MGCKQSTPLKEETVVVVASPVKVASPKHTTRAASPAKEAVHEEAPTPVVEEESTPVETSEPVVEEAPVEAVVEETPAPVVVAEAPVAPVVEEKTAKRRVRVKKQKEAPVPVSAKPEPFSRATMNDENAIVSSFKKETVVVAEAPSSPLQEKRVAFAPRAIAKSNVTAAKGKGKMSKKEAEAQRVKEMTMAFQRLLTHADHLENHLATRNTYTNKA